MMVRKTFPIELLRPFWLPHLHRIRGPQIHGVQAWLANGLYWFNSNPTKGEFRLYVRDEKEIAGAFAADIARTATACFESIYGLRKTPKLPKSTAWVLVRLYYGAYFAAHTIIRILGRSCSYLDKGHLRILRENAEMACCSWTGNTSQGLFALQYTPASKELSCSRLRNAHGDLWKTVYSCFSDLSEKVLQQPGLSKEKETVATFLMAVNDCLDNCKSRSSGTWLSEFRNRLNYRQEFGAWFPYRDCQVKYPDIERYIRRWNADLSTLRFSQGRAPAVERFAESCTAIIALCHAMLHDLRRISRVETSFDRYAHTAFLRRTGMAPKQ